MDPTAEALAVLDRHMAALNARDADALAKTLHFPHYRLSGGRLKTWDGPASYFADFLARAGDGWHHSAWTRRTPVAVTAEKVHLDVMFSRYRADNAVLGQFGSLWVVSLLEGRWAAQLRSSFAA
jgi:hypothetical protein